LLLSVLGVPEIKALLASAGRLLTRLRRGSTSSDESQGGGQIDG
jgi:hypothetical protein